MFLAKTEISNGYNGRGILPLIKNRWSTLNKAAFLEMPLGCDLVLLHRQSFRVHKTGRRFLSRWGQSNQSKLIRWWVPTKLEELRCANIIRPKGALLQNTPVDNKNAHILPSSWKFTLSLWCMKKPESKFTWETQEISLLKYKNWGRMSADWKNYLGKRAHFLISTYAFVSVCELIICEMYDLLLWRVFSSCHVSWSIANHSFFLEQRYT